MKSETQRAAHGADVSDDVAGQTLPASYAWLSALADGDADAAQPACTAWRDDASARERWHTYQLIGDVMRSDELAARPAHDAAFLAGLRTRLAAEPVVLAPTEPLVSAATAKSAARRRPVWLMPAAAAAGFVVVAGVLVVSRVGSPGGAIDAPAMASMQADRSGVQPVSNVQQGSKRPLLVRSEGVIRDAQLDEYLRAHQAARGGFAVAQPGGTMRRVEGVMPASPER